MKLKRKCLTILIVTLLIISFCHFHVKKAKGTYVDEDYMTYAIVDPNSHITRQSNHLELMSYENEACYLYKDYGTEYFTTFNVTFQTNVTKGTPDENCYAGILGFANVVADFGYIGSYGLNAIRLSVNAYPYSDSLKIYLTARVGGNNFIDSSIFLLFATDYYVTVQRLTSSVVCKIHNDSERTHLVDTLSVSMVAYSFRYIYGCSSYDHYNNYYVTIDNYDLKVEREAPQYYFNFSFYDVDSEDVEIYVDWELWNSTHNIGYSEGDVSLESGTYYLKTQKYGHLINTSTLDTATYGNSTININLNMKRHESCPNGFITSNDTISSISIYADTPQLLNFTMEGTPPDQHGVGVPKNASYILEDGVNMTDWTYEQSPSHIHWNQSNGGAELLFDSYSETNKDEDHPLQTVHPSSELQRSSYGQTFKTSSNNAYKISKVKFYLRKYGTPTGNLIVRLYAHTGTFGSSGIPTGSSLANGSSFSIASLTTSYQLIEFTFSGTHQYLMELNTAYCIQLEVADGVLGSGNYVMVGADFSTASHEGNQVRYLYSAWAYETTKDTCFYLYGIDMTHDFALVFPSTTGPVSGPHTPINNRVKVTVRLNAQWLKGCNVTVQGGPDNRLEWALTDLRGTVKFKLRTGSYDIVANYEQYSKTKTVYVSSHMTIGIDLTEEDIIRPFVIPEEVLAWFGLPEIDFTTETFLVLLLPLIVLAVYVVKKVAEGGKRKWKYSYLR